jgi:DNA polymerase delta subunit 1
MVVHNTDSIMAIVDVPATAVTETEKMEHVMTVAKTAAADISTRFKKPMKLLFEKVYYPYLLISKKRYSGLKWTKPEKADGVDTKGIEAVRRDNPPILRDTVNAMLKCLAFEKDVGKATKIGRVAMARLGKIFRCAGGEE